MAHASFQGRACFGVHRAPGLVEHRLAARAEHAANHRREGGSVLRIGGKKLGRIAQLIGRPDLWQEALVGLDATIKVGIGARHRCSIVDRHGADGVLYPQALETGVELQFRCHLPGILQVELHRFCLERVAPLGEERITLELQEAALRSCPVQAIEAPELLEVVGLDPEAAIERVIAQSHGRRAEQTGAFDVVFGGADRQGRVVGGGACHRRIGRDHVRRAPQPLALVGVAIELGPQIDAVAHWDVGQQIGQLIVAQAGGIEI
jgi:hypothetical protein